MINSKLLELLNEGKIPRTGNFDVFYHGSPSGEWRGEHYGIHVGTHQAAKEALEAKIGVKSKGEWDGTTEYGKTLIAGKKRLKEIDPRCYNQTGYNCSCNGDEVPEEDYYPTSREQTKKYSNGEKVPFSVKPKIYKVKIVGPMSNTPKITR